MRGFPKVRFRLAVGVVCAAVAALVALAAVSVTQTIHGESKMVVDRPVHAASLKESFAILSSRHSNQCGLKPGSLGSIAARGRLQGSCCSPMSLSHYADQIHGLAKYASVAEIPQDPYDVSVGLAQRLTAYVDDIKLTPEQRSIYRQALTLAHEHGPCCCHCWRWSAFEGQAKYLITQRAYTGRRIAAVWDLEDGCGGA